MKYSIAHLARELLAEELALVGKLMDAVDTKQQEPNADYMRAAATATRILTRHPRCGVLAEVVATSPALLELRSNVALGRAINLGLCDLPDVVRKCLSPAGAPANALRR